MERKALFVTGEGIDGSGKTTALQHLQEYYQSRGFKTVYIREPGSTEVSEKIRELLMYGNLDAKTKLLLFQASRADLIANVLTKELAESDIVLCDRYIDSTVAYQVYGEGLDVHDVTTLNNYVAGVVTPDLTLLFDVTVPTAIARTHQDEGRMLTTFDKKEEQYFQRVQEGYKQLYEENSRFVLIQAEDTKENVLKDCIHVINKKLKKQGREVPN